MRLRLSIRALLPALLCILLAVPALAQRGPGGGGPGGPGGGGFGGGGFGGGHMGMPPPSMGHHNTMSGDGIGVHSGPQLTPPGRWWNDHHTIKELKIRPEQQQKMDDIFNSNKGQLVTAFDNLKREEARMDAMTPQDLQDEGKVFAEIDRLETARADLAKQTVHLALEFRKTLDSTQLATLDKEMANLR